MSSPVGNPELVSQNSILPQNQGYRCSGSSLDATAQLQIEKSGNKGFYGLTLNSLYSVSVLVPGTDSTQLGSVQTNDLSQTNLTITANVATGTPASTQASKQMTITPQVLYYDLGSNQYEANTFKNFTTVMPLKGGVITGTKKNCWLAVKVLDPSSCSNPSNVFPTRIQGNFYTDIVAKTKAVYATMTYYPPAGGAGTTVTVNSVRPYYFPSLNSFTGLRIDSDPADWILINFDASSLAGASLDNVVLTLNSYIPANL